MYLLNKTQKMILLVVFYGCKTYSLTLSEAKFGIFGGVQYKDRGKGNKYIMTNY